MRNTLVVNLFAGPGAGKSTLAAWLFAQLKLQGESAELITEFAKEKVWADETASLNDQFYVSGNHCHKFWTLNGKVDYIITDSPVLLGLIYNPYSSSFKQLLLDAHKSMPSFNIFLCRNKPYNPEGRLQTKAEALACDDKIIDMLNGNEIGYSCFWDYGIIAEHNKLVDRIKQVYSWRFKNADTSS